MEFFKALLILSLLLPTIGYSDSRVRILVIDTGVDSGNPALSQVFCPKEESFDATTGKYEIPSDTHGHGTHVAGIIRALGGPNGYCLAFCKYYRYGDGGMNLRRTTSCLRHAKTIGAAYVNYSSGGNEFYEDEKLAIEELDGKFIVAAGNDASDIDAPNKRYYPGAHHLPNELIVGSYDSKCKRSSTSNYGKDVVYYLGEEVYSSVPGNRREAMSGTSMATAVATGAALRRLLGLPRIGDCGAYSKFIRSFWKTH